MPLPFFEPVSDPSTEDYAAIGNCRTLALVSRFGSIDWWCLPDFSGPSVFAALLDRRRGGRFALTPLRIERAEQAYDDGTNVLRTRFHCADGLLELVDFMTMPEAGGANDEPHTTHEIVRIARCIEGSVELQALFEPRPDYAREAATIHFRGEGHWHCAGPGFEARMSTSIPFAAEADGSLRARVRLHRGEQHMALLRSPGVHASPPAALCADAEDRLVATVGWWRGWCGRCTYEGKYRDAVTRSALALKLLTHRPSGAVVAAGTTSLPEDGSGERNWDYRYCWLRDASLVLEGFSDLGYVAESDAFLRWLLHATKRTRPQLQVTYDVYGKADLHEQVLPHLQGYHGIGPVRIGNAASDQRQHDVYGEVILTACSFVERGGQLNDAEKSLLAGFADMVCRLWRSPDHGLWEIRLPPRHNTHSKLMCWAALDRTLQLDRTVGLPIDAPRIAAERDAVRADIEAHGYDAKLNAYVGYYGSTFADASLLLIPRLGYAAADDPRMLGTLRHIRRQLSAGGMLYRYPPGVGYDGIEGPEHLFALCNFWCVGCLARQGRIDEASALYEALLGLRNHVGLYAEEFDVQQGRPMGNFPQAFSHVGLITAALALSQAS